MPSKQTPPAQQPLQKTPQRILLVEDEKHLAFTLELNLKAEGFEVIAASNGNEAIAFYEGQGPFAAIILDVMLPERDGFEVAQHIRQQDNRTGILMLTARAADEDRLKGLHLGIDDYITKPFHLQELLMRVKRMVERAAFYQGGPQTTLITRPLHYGPFTLDADALLLESPSGRHELTALEADMLAEFIAAPEKVLSRKYLLSKVWGMPGNVETRTVDNFIVRLRRVLELDPTKPQYLVSVRGRGYRLTIPGRPSLELNKKEP